MKQTIRLNEQELHRLIRESVQKVLKEDVIDEQFQNCIQNAIFSLSGVMSHLGKESESFAYDGDSKMIPDGEANLKYYKIYELCSKTMKALQSLQQ